MPLPLLSTEKLGLRVEKRTLLKNLSISLNRGTFVAVTGPSGSGKTTLLRTLTGALTPAEGKVISNLDSTKSLAMIFQDLQLADGATAINNVLGGSLGRHSFLSTLFRFPAKERKEAYRLLAKFK